MATWRALLSPSRDISIQESCQQEHSTQVKRPKVVTQSTNQSQQKPTIKREYSKSIDKAFIQSSSTDMLEVQQKIKESKYKLLMNKMNQKNCCCLIVQI